MFQFTPDINTTFILYGIFFAAFLSSALYSFARDIKMDLNNRNQVISRKKIINTYKNILPLSLFNVILITLPTFYIISGIIKPRQFRCVDLLWEFILLTVCTDITYFTFHYILHIPILYKYFHKIHHRIKEPVGLSGVYFHPFDFIFGNIIPVALPLIILHSSIPVIICWTVLVISNTILNAHSGLKTSIFHENHHILFNKNYGTNGFMDKLMNTYSIE